MSLKNRLKARRESGKKEAVSTEITAAQFLGLEEGKTGYSNLLEYSKYLESLRDTEADELEEFFEKIKEGHRMANSTVRRVDKSGRPYIYCSFILPNANPGYKVIVEAGMLEFIKHYQLGKIKINFTISELAEIVFNE
ncbi:hypothetical protein Pedsa_0556 [Pseudopedobacter saltans DSM 12145]|uniref:Uncharacterized protein n=1 Tax=Pseudopedobacter saltans (strain ATCC 51119 / DSM 12145 / JCM 21818 / CCUG 39354 / LMG 10337 / NBRC 100064 / NCIMB 13643) TaxID=762903 RepID=F0S7B0_PSESL|nr:hypothetical protein [Pseudopedobacter saltans]ADY51135.1 hypothetical protein Pedsa_0556 [Pseudopedobacter saltans DSM 12145]